MNKINSTLLILIIFFLVSCKSNDSKHAQEHGSKSNINYFGNYKLINPDYGTETIVTISGNTRTMITNALPNHKTGTFPSKGNPNTISAQEKMYTFPVNPKYIGKAQWIRETGIALNGVKFEPGTAEVVNCDTGENYRVEAQQNVIDLGLDFNFAHVQPTGAYHYHGTPTSLIEANDIGNDLVHIGFAHDGFPMYYSKSGKYKPSFKLLAGTREGEDCTYRTHRTIEISVSGHHDGTYGSDFEYIEGFGDLDACNGTTIDGEYVYLVTKEFPYISRCLMGEVPHNKGYSVGFSRGGKHERGREERPNATQILEKMDANNDDKLSQQEIKGPLKDSFFKVDNNKDSFISKEELLEFSKLNNHRSQKRK